MRTLPYININWFKFVTVLSSCHLYFDMLIMELGTFFHFCIFCNNNVSHTAFAPLQETPVGTLWTETKKCNIGISPLWAQLEKGQREQWNYCACVGAVHRELLSNHSKGGKIISRKWVSFFPLTWSNLVDKENFEPLIYRQHLWQLHLLQQGVERKGLDLKLNHLNFWMW